MSREELDPHPAWRPLYFETAQHSYWKHRQLAQRLLDLLNCPLPLPERENACRQGNAAACGYWVLHYIEELCRRKLNYGSLVLPFSQAFRTQQLMKIYKRLDEHDLDGGQDFPLSHS